MTATAHTRPPARLTSKSPSPLSPLYQQPVQAFSVQGVTLGLRGVHVGPAPTYVGAGRFNRACQSKKHSFIDHPSSVFYLHVDHLNTPRLATNQTGQEVWRWKSDAFAQGLHSGSSLINLRFPGQYYDSESGLHYNYFRDYKPQTERYIENDPTGLKGG